MDKIAKSGMKIDLHIHSMASHKKDGAKVKNNTVDNIPLLISKLNENQVNICAITDHDTFSYDMYKALKLAEDDDSSVKKVLPGVEFSVRFMASDGNEKTVHIVAIFSDKCDDKVARIETVLKNHGPDSMGSYSEEEFLKTLREIDLDTILIAHQKNTLTSKSPRKNDANSLGEERFLEFLSTDFFEAFEFKNKRNEILNKSHIFANHLEDKLRFVTGTDCHDWSVYPNEDPSDKTTDFPYTFAKCLPTFRGLVMAVTGNNRLKRVNSFYNVDKYALDRIEIEINNRSIDIPLSKGINVIIGDNSIGKSLLLHALCGYKKDGEKLSKSVKDGYKSYIKNNGIKIKSGIDKANVFAFDMQGEVRRKFEENKLVATEFSRYFPKDINPEPYQAIINNEIERLMNYLRKKFMLDKSIKQLSPFTINIDELDPESLIFVANLRSSKSSVDNISDIVAALRKVEIDITELTKLSLDEEDDRYFKEQLQTISKIKGKYQNRKNDINKENDRIETVANVIDTVNSQHSQSISDRQKKNATFTSKTDSLIKSLVEIIKQKYEIKLYSPEIGEIEVEIAENKVHNYCFVSKLKVDVINSDYFMQHIKSVLRANAKLDFCTITEDELKEMLLQYNSSIPVLDFFKAELSRSFEEDLKPRKTIVLANSDKREEFSAGLNAKIYFDLLSYENNSDGIYIIDQPEDNVSQPSIKNYLIDCFNTMAENRQVIMVSHNPQFIVNLDVDNLIYISRKSDGEITVQSGALEYECDDYSVLKLVEENIDGGLDSIQKRWKRYEKANRT